MADRSVQLHPIGAVDLPAVLRLRQAPHAVKGEG